MAIVIDRMIFHRPWKRSLPLIALWTAMAIVPLLLTRGVQLSLMIFRPQVELRPFVALDAIGFYLAKLFLPLGLGVDQGRSPMTLLQHGTLRWSWIPAALFCCAIWLGRKRWPGLIAPSLIFLAGLAPVLGFSPFIFQDISTVADRFAYLAMLGPALLLAQIVAAFPREITWVVTGTAILLLASLSFVQTGYWRDDLSLMTHSLQVAPQVEPVTEMLAAAVSREGALDRGDTLYRQVLSMKWDDAAALIGLGSNMHKQHRLPEAARCLQEAIIIEPGNADARFNYGNVLLAAREPGRAVGQYEIALQSQPRSVPVLVNLGAALAMAGSWQQSEAMFRRALEAAPASAEAHFGLGRVLEQRGDLAAALAEYEAALEQNPQLAQAQNGRTRVVAMMQR